MTESSTVDKNRGKIKGSGRVAGTPNKATRNTKEALQEAFEKLGGVNSLVSWGKDNQTEFYKLWSKIIPLDVNANVSGGITVNITRFTDDDSNTSKQLET